MVRRKYVKNILNKYLSEEIKSCPHYIDKENWVFVKSACSEFKTTLTDEILTESDLIKAFRGIEEVLQLFNMNDEQQYECKNHFYDLISHYLLWAEKMEKFECAYNIKFVQDLLAIKVKVEGL